MFSCLQVPPPRKLQIRRWGNNRFKPLTQRRDPRHPQTRVILSWASRLPKLSKSKLQCANPRHMNHRQKYPLASGFAGDCSSVNLELRHWMLFPAQKSKALHGRAQRGEQRVTGLPRILHLGREKSRFSHRVDTPWFCSVVILLSWNILWLIKGS